MCCTELRLVPRPLYSARPIRVRRFWAADVFPVTLSDKKRRYRSVHLGVVVLLVCEKFLCNARVSAAMLLRSVVKSDSQEKSSKILISWQDFKYRFLSFSFFLAKRRAKLVYNLVAREARAVRRPRVHPSELQTRSAHLYLYISDGVCHDVIQ